MVFRLDRKSRLPYPAQVQRQAVAHVVAGRLQAGDRLPSVRELAQRLSISRTTAERIQEALGEAMPVEVRPRSGAFVGGPDSAEATSATIALTQAHAIHDLIQDVLDRAGRLGVDAARLGQLLRLLELERQGKHPETLKRFRWWRPPTVSNAWPEACPPVFRSSSCAFLQTRGRNRFRAELPISCAATTCARWLVGWYFLLFWEVKINPTGYCAVD